MYRPLINSEEINQLDLIQFEGPIHVVSDIETQETIANRLMENTLLGFDTEARPSFKKGVIHPVSLLQLSTKKEAYLFRLNESGIGDNLKNILSSSEIKKVGVAIEDDIIDLQRLRPFVARGFISLEREVKKVGIESNGLRKIAAIILKKRISKGAQVSNWDADELTDKQLTYAATDAWISIRMLEELNKSHPDIFIY